MRVEGFREKVKEWWASFPVNGTASFRLATKLKVLKKIEGMGAGE